MLWAFVASDTFFPDACVAAVVPLTPRVTVHVVAPNPAVTVISSCSTRMLKLDGGKLATPALEACAAAVVPLTPRVTVQVVVPNPAVTVISSESIQML